MSKLIVAGMTNFRIKIFCSSKEVCRCWASVSFTSLEKVKEHCNLFSNLLVSYLYVILEKVAPHMKIRGGITFVDEIPRNTNGKILRRVLRASVKAKL